MMDKRKIDGTTNESSAELQIHKSDIVVYVYTIKNLEPYTLSKTGSYGRLASRLVGWQTKFR